jgi:hypothetical protein
MPDCEYLLAAESKHGYWHGLNAANVKRVEAVFESV